MPEADAGRLRALDGLRAVAVVLVMAYHGGVPGLRTAGYFGVDVFFVLSGFLITGLLLGEEGRWQGIRLGAFWGRRARRLLPGLLVMLAAVDLYVASVAPVGLYPGFRDDALSVVAYISNWHFVATSSDYFAATGAPSLLTHTWSLAIEEQFYIVWPLALWAVCRLARRRGRDPAGAVLVVAGTAAMASALWMAVLYRSGASPSRLYYGTDTRAQSILAGVALAALLARHRGLVRRATPLPVMAAAGAGLLWASCRLGSADGVTYQGGFALVAGLSAILVGGLVAHPEGPASGVLGRAVPAYLGRISYGMYLWYFPLFEILDHARTGQTGAGLFALRCAADVAAAAASFHLVEQPIRGWRPGASRSAWPRLAPLGASVASLAAVSALVLANTPPVEASSVSTTVAAANVAAANTAAAPPGALRVLVVGDSTGATLGMALAVQAVSRRYGILVDDRAGYGCGLVISSSLLEHGVATPPAPACDAATAPADRWPALDRAEARRFRPDVVLVVAGRWEVTTRRPRPGAPWTDITRPGDAADVTASLEQVWDLATGSGARLAVATAPCFSSGEQPDGSAWPEDSPARLAAYNTVVRRFVAAHAGTALVDLDAMVCLDGHYRTALDGVTVRAPDGVHYPYFSVGPAAETADPDTLSQVEAFGLWIAARVVPAMRDGAP